MVCRKGVGACMGLQVAMARIGTAVALAVSLPVARWMGDVSYPVLFGAILLCVGICFIYDLLCDWTARKMLLLQLFAWKMERPKKKASSCPI